MATAVTDSSSNEGNLCPICMDVFKSPRQLPCLHSCCEHCLRDYITKKARTSMEECEGFMCPVCRAVTRPPKKEKQVLEWASLFPYTPFPPGVKSKVHRTCEVCLNISNSSPNLAQKFCIICEEFMCTNCALYHQNMKNSKSHQMITMEEWETNPENRIKCTVGSCCSEHDNEDIKFYCRSHEAAFCGTCLFHHHKSCLEVLELKEKLPHLLKEMKPQKVMEQMRKLEEHLENFMKTNEESIGNLEPQVHNISAEIRVVRRQLNTVLDDIEKMVKMEGNRIYKEWLIRKQEQNQRCQSLVSVIRNAQGLLETVCQYGKDTQKFVVTRKMIKQLYCYSDQIREKFERIDNIKIRLELDSNMKAIITQDTRDLVKIAIQEERKYLQCTNLMVPFEDTSVQLSRVIDIRWQSHDNPIYNNIAHLPDGYTVLVDTNNKAWGLLDSSYNCIASQSFRDCPFDVCLIGDFEVAISFSRTVQFLSFSDQSLRVTGMVTTMYPCLCVGCCGEGLINGKCYWSLIHRNGNVKLHCEFHNQWTSHAYVAIDKYRSRLYISVSAGNAVYCFGLLDGKEYFVYLSNDLKQPYGVAVDREDNVYVVGHGSNNIHILSSDGFALQVITSGVPKTPRGISFDHSKGYFYVSNDQSRMNKKLYCFKGIKCTS